MFTRNSALVKIWVRRIKNGENSRDQLPTLFNLREVVEEILDEEISNEEILNK